MSDWNCPTLPALSTAGFANGLPTATPNSLSLAWLGQLPLHEMAVNTSPVRGSATMGPCHWNRSIEVASLKLLAPRSLLGRIAPGSAG